MPTPMTTDPHPLRMPTSWSTTDTDIRLSWNGVEWMAFVEQPEQPQASS